MPNKQNKTNQYMKTIILGFLLIACSTITYSQDLLKEVKDFYSNGKPAMIVYKNSDLKIVKVEYYGENGEISSYYQYDPASGKLDGEYYSHGKKGVYNQGKVKECLDCYFSLGNNWYMIGNQKNGNFSGEQEVYELRSISYTAKEKLTGYYVNYATGEYEKVKKGTIFFDENGELDGKVTLNDGTKLFFDHGDFLGFTRPNPSNISTSKDSIFKGNKIWKVDNTFIPNNGCMQYRWILSDYNNFIVDVFPNNNFIFFGYENMEAPDIPQDINFNYRGQEGVSGHVFLSFKDEFTFPEESISFRTYGYPGDLEIFNDFARDIGEALHEKGDRCYNFSREFLMENNYQEMFLNSTLSSTIANRIRELEGIDFYEVFDWDANIGLGEGENISKSRILDYIYLLLTSQTDLFPEMGFDKAVEDVWIIENGKIVKLLNSQTFAKYKIEVESRMELSQLISENIGKLQKSISDKNYSTAKKNFNALNSFSSNELSGLNKKLIKEYEIVINSYIKSFDDEIQKEKQEKISKYAEKVNSAVEKYAFSEAIMWCDSAKSIDYPNAKVDDLLNHITRSQNQYFWQVLDKSFPSGSFNRELLDLSRLMIESDNIVTHFEKISEFEGVVDNPLSRIIGRFEDVSGHIKKINLILEDLSEMKEFALRGIYLTTHGVILDLSYEKKPKTDWGFSKDELQLAFESYKSSNKDGIKSSPLIFYSFDGKAYFFPGSRLFHGTKSVYNSSKADSDDVMKQSASQGLNLFNCYKTFEEYLKGRNFEYYCKEIEF